MELQVSLIISAILVLSAGVLVSFSTAKFNQLRKEAAVFNDISHAFATASHHVREAEHPPAIQISGTSSIWVNNEKLLVGNGATGLIRTTGPDPSYQWVYLPDASNEGDREVLFDIEQKDYARKPARLVLETSSDTVRMRFYGQKDEIPFDLATRIGRRRQ